MEQASVDSAVEEGSLVLSHPESNVLGLMRLPRRFQGLLRLEQQQQKIGSEAIPLVGRCI